MTEAMAQGAEAYVAARRAWRRDQPRAQQAAPGTIAPSLPGSYDVAEINPLVQAEIPAISRLYLHVSITPPPRTEELPFVSNDLMALLDDIEAIRALPKDFDGEGSEPYTSATINAAAWALGTLWFTYRIGYQAALPTPTLEPAPDGAVDIHWRSTPYELVIGIPKDGKGDLEAYGTDHDTDKIHLTGALSEVGPRATEWLHRRWPALPQ